jgi:hypothetical protein
MKFGEMLVYKLWYSMWRRPFRAVARRLFGNKHERRILLGLLKGHWWIDDGWLCPQSMGIYELHVQYDAIRRMLAPGGILYDFGAHYGFMSFWGAKVVGPSGHFYSFELLPGSSQRIAELMCLNNVMNYTLVSKAASHISREGVELFYEDGSTAAPSLCRGDREKECSDRDNDSRRIRSRALPAESGQARLRRLGKMVLEWTRQLLRAFTAPIWIIEIHNSGNNRSITSLLWLHGYCVRTFDLPCRPSKPYPRHIIALKHFAGIMGGNS